MLLKTNASIDEKILDQFIWKCKEETIEVGTELVVHESQQAVFIRNGKALGVLGPGRHCLDDTKLTFLQSIAKTLFKRKKCFDCEIYFVNHAVQMDMQWGTRERVNTMLEVEPGKAVPLSVGASGTMNLQADPNQVMTLLNYLLGMGQQLDRDGVRRIFSGLMATTIKSYLGRVLQDQHMLVFALDQHLDAISKDLLGLLKPEFEVYGLVLREFYVTTLVLPEENPIYQDAKLLYHERYTSESKAEIRRNLEQSEADFKRNLELDNARHEVDIAKLKSEKDLIDAQTKAQSSVFASQAEQARRSMEGITSIQEHQFETFNHMIDANVAAAQKNVMPVFQFGKEGAQAQGVIVGNPAGMASDAMQAGMGMQVVKGMGDLMQNVFGQTPDHQAQSQQISGMQIPGRAGSAPGWVCGCGKENPQDHAFCGNCGKPRPAEEQEKTWVCSCGKENPVSNAFCGGCGRPRPAQEKKEWICKCGNVNPADSNFCGKCGNRRGG